MSTLSLIGPIQLAEPMGTRSTEQGWRMTIGPWGRAAQASGPSMHAVVTSMPCAQRTRRYRRRGPPSPPVTFTVYLCTSCTAEPKLAVLEELRATIRRCAHGMLVTTACMLGPLGCAARPHGPIVILQPCSVERVPIGSASWYWADQRQSRHTCPAGLA